MTGSAQSVQTVVVGAGVVGLAVARSLALSGREVIVLERANAIGMETSSRNSEVIHAGIYYPAGSLKARLCVAGKQALYRYCTEKEIAHQRTGKLIVAVDSAEVSTLERYYAQAAHNGVDDLRWLSAKDVLTFEPAVTAVRGLLSPSTGIIDSHEFMLSLQADVEAHGGLVALNTAVVRIAAKSHGFDLQCDSDGETRLRCQELVNAAGLHAPALAGGIDSVPAAFVPHAYLSKGHYFTLSGRSPFSRLVYPVANDQGLGVHVTLDLAGAARFGPDTEWVDTINYDFDESRRDGFVAAIRRYYPDLDPERLQPAYTGLRPKVAGPGEPPADFIVQGAAEHGVAGLVNLFGIESPGLTASLAIADLVRESL